MCDDDRRNMKGHHYPNVAFGIPFSLHLMRRDGVMCVMAVYVVATCHILIG